MSEITIDKKFLEGLRKAYDKAVKDDVPNFIYNGHEFVTNYAKYFLEFHGPKFNLK